MPDVVIIIKAVNEATDELKEVNRELEDMHQINKKNAKQYEHLARQAKFAGIALLGVAAAGGAVIFKSAQLAARVETLGVVLKGAGNAAGISDKQLEAFEETLKGMGITTQGTRQAMLQMVQAQIPLTDQTAKLARVAQNAAVVIGTDSTEAFTRLITAIQRGETEMLRTMGIVVDFGGAYKRVADETDRTAKELSLAEKQQIRINEVFRVAAPIMNAYEDAMGTAGKQSTSMVRLQEELSLALGNQVLPAYTKLTTGVYDLLKAWNEQDTATKEVQTSMFVYGTALSGATGAGLIFLSQLPKLIAGIKTLKVTLMLANGILLPFAAAIALAGAAIVKEKARVSSLKDELLLLVESQQKGEISSQQYQHAALEAAIASEQFGSAQERANQFNLSVIESNQELIEKYGIVTAAQLDAADSANEVADGWLEAQRRAAGLAVAVESAAEELEELESVEINVDFRADTSGLFASMEKGLGIAERGGADIALVASLLPEVDWSQVPPFVRNMVLQEGQAMAMLIEANITGMEDADLEELETKILEATTLTEDELEEIWTDYEERGVDAVNEWSKRAIQLLANRVHPAMFDAVQPMLDQLASFKDKLERLVSKTWVIKIEYSQAIPGSARGGPLPPISIVGEEGPEMIINGVVIPAGETRRLQRLGLTAQGFQSGGMLPGTNVSMKGGGSASAPDLLIEQNQLLQQLVELSQDRGTSTDFANDIAAALGQ